MRKIKKPLKKKTNHKPIPTKQSPEHENSRRKKPPATKTDKHVKKLKEKEISKQYSTIPVESIVIPVILPPIEIATSDIKKRKHSKDKMYFTSDTEDGVILYNESDDQLIRNQIYNSRIKYAFEKLVENVFNTFKFSYFETGPLEVQKETVAHLVANMHKFEKNKGKAFGYFSVIAKNYLIFQNNTNYKRFNQHVEIGEDNGKHACKLQQEDSYYKEQENREFINLMVEYWEKNVCKIFTKQRDIEIANAVVELFRNSDRIDAFNKKALYLYIREISSCKTQQITKVVNRMKNYQSNISRSYAEVGIV